MLCRLLAHSPRATSLPACSSGAVYQAQTWRGRTLQCRCLRGAGVSPLGAQGKLAAEALAVTDGGGGHVLHTRLEAPQIVMPHSSRGVSAAASLAF